MAAKTYEEWKPSNEQALKLADAADVFGKMVWDAAWKSAVAQNSTSTNTAKFPCVLFREAMTCRMEDSDRTCGDYPCQLTRQL